MRVYFRKFGNRVETEFYQWNNFRLTYNESFPKEVSYVENSLMKIMEEKFESFYVNRTVNHGMLFKFNDPADEAAFLLWSNDGIEI